MLAETPRRGEAARERHEDMNRRGRDAKLTRRESFEKRRESKTDVVRGLAVYDGNTGQWNMMQSRRGAMEGMAREAVVL